MKTKLLGFLVVALLADPIAAHSTPVRYDFYVSGGASGPLAGQTASGTFTFDSSIIAAGGGVVNQTGLLTDLAFTWGGFSYDALTANTGAMTFGSGGGDPLSSTTFGTNCDAGGCQAQSDSAQTRPQWYLQVYANSPGFFVYAVYGDSEDLFTGAATFAPVPVPEPPPLTLFSIGLVALFLGERWRRGALGARRPAMSRQSG
ncbi:MAG: hypothetical protein WBV35_19220 [Steroidobacteraceae bacterium]